MTPRWPAVSGGKPYNSRNDRGVRRGRPVKEESHGGRRSLRREMTMMIPRESGDGGDTPTVRTRQSARVKVMKLSVLLMRSEVVRRGVAAKGAMVVVEAAFS
jgi:hypothetical protein